MPGRKIPAAWPHIQAKVIWDPDAEDHLTWDARGQCDVRQMSIVVPREYAVGVYFTVHNTTSRVLRLHVFAVRNGIKQLLTRYGSSPAPDAVLVDPSKCRSSSALSVRILPKWSGYVELPPAYQDAFGYIHAASETRGVIPDSLEFVDLDTKQVLVLTVNVTVSTTETRQTRRSVRVSNAG